MITTLILGFLSGLGGGEIFLILAVLLLFFGANKIPQLARGLGQGMSEFRRASQSVVDEMQKDPVAPAAPTRKVEDGKEMA